MLNLMFISKIFYIFNFSIYIYIYIFLDLQTSVGTEERMRWNDIIESRVGEGPVDGH